MSEAKEINQYTLAAIGIVGGIIAILLAYFLNNTFHVSYFSFLGAIGAILAAVWGADAVMRICKYGIGSGVPSIGMLAFGMGLLTTLVGLKVGDYVNVVYVGPIVALILSMVQGAVIGYLANAVLKMKIPTMQIGMIFLAGSASIVLMGYTTAITGSFDFTTVIKYVFATGYVAPLFMLGALPLFHPHNACMGPDESQKILITLSVEAGFLSMIIFGVLSVALFQSSLLSSLITIVIGLLGWGCSYLTYFRMVKESGVQVLGSGVLPKKEA